MSAPLVTEVLTYLANAPAEMTPAERMVLLVIGERSQPIDRPDWPARTCGTSVVELAALVGVQPVSLGRVLQRLRARGLEVRVQIGTTRHGAPVFAKRGHATDFRLPDLAPVAPISDFPQVDVIARTRVRPTGVSPDSRPRKAGLSSATAQTRVRPQPEEPEGTTPQPPAHANEGHSLDRLTRLVRENRVPIPAEHLLAYAYEMSRDGNPWPSTQAITAVVEGGVLRGAHSPERKLRAALGLPSTRQPVRSPRGAAS